jgi:hypothetical protein
MLLLPFRFGRLNDRGWRDGAGSSLARRRLCACTGDAPAAALRRQQRRHVDAQQPLLQPDSLAQHRTVAAQDLLLMRDEEFAVIGGAAHKRGILEEMSEPDVAVAAEETAHHAQIMRVIDTEHSLPLPAHETQAALALEHPVVILQRQSVFRPQPALPPALLCPVHLGAVFGIGRVAVSLVRVDLFAIGRVPGAFVGKLPGATCRILCISLSFVWTGHGDLAGVAPA